MSGGMWVLVGVAGWMGLGLVAAIALGRSIRLAEAAQPEWDVTDGFGLCTCGCELADWARPESTDVLGDVDARFWVIANDLRRTA